MKLSERFAPCELRLTSLRPGISNLTVCLMFDWFSFPLLGPVTWLWKLMLSYLQHPKVRSGRTSTSLKTATGEQPFFPMADRRRDVLTLLFLLKVYSKREFPHELPTTTPRERCSKSTKKTWLQIYMMCPQLSLIMLSELRLFARAISQSWWSIVQVYLWSWCSRPFTWGNCGNIFGWTVSLNVSVCALQNTLCVSHYFWMCSCCLVLHSVLQLSPRENEVFYDVVAIVDPLSREAQKMSALLFVSCALVSFSILCQSKGPINTKQNAVFDKTRASSLLWCQAFSIDESSYSCPGNDLGVLGNKTVSTQWGAVWCMETWKCTKRTHICLCQGRYGITSICLCGLQQNNSVMNNFLIIP